MMLVFGWSLLSARAEPGDGTDEALYAEHCSGCHGKRGHATFPGVMMGAGSFASEDFWRDRPLERLPRSIALGGKAVGLKSAMPAFGEVLTESEIERLLAFVLSLRPSGS